MTHTSTNEAQAVVFHTHNGMGPGIRRRDNGNPMDAGWYWFDPAQSPFAYGPFLSQHDAEKALSGRI